MITDIAKFLFGMAIGLFAEYIGYGILLGITYWAQWYALNRAVVNDLPLTTEQSEFMDVMVGEEHPIRLGFKVMVLWPASVWRNHRANREVES